MDDSRKWVILSVIPLIIILVIIYGNWNWNPLITNTFNTVDYRISDYQYHEPIVSWWLLYRSDGWYYIGEYSNNKNEKPQKKRSGFWAMYYPDWCVLTGNWVNWIVEWMWTYDCNEWIYEWEFKDNKINWLWVLKNRDNSSYSWEWLNEEPHWFWILKYADWESYEWYWVKWTKEWTWKYTYSDGRVFEWAFLNWLKNWKWKIIYPDGTIQEWVWEDDMLQEPINTWDNKNEADQN